MVREAKQPKRVHPCPHCLTKFRSPSHRNAHVRAVHENEKWRHCSPVLVEWQWQHGARRRSLIL